MTFDHFFTFLFFIKYNNSLKFDTLNGEILKWIFEFFFGKNL